MSKIYFVRFPGGNGGTSDLFLGREDDNDPCLVSDAQAADAFDLIGARQQAAEILAGEMPKMLLYASKYDLVKMQLCTSTITALDDSWQLTPVNCTMEIVAVEPVVRPVDDLNHPERCEVIQSWTLMLDKQEYDGNPDDLVRPEVPNNQRLIIDDSIQQLIPFIADSELKNAVLNNMNVMGHDESIVNMFGFVLDEQKAVIRMEAEANSGLQGSMIVNTSITSEILAKYKGTRVGRPATAEKAVQFLYTATDKCVWSEFNDWFAKN
jgi:hypothetical protein